MPLEPEHTEVPPEYVIAYAAGLMSGVTLAARPTRRTDRPRILAGWIAAAGLGTWLPDVLWSLSQDWLRAHVAPEVLVTLKLGE